jgi:hypothetical protein
MNEFNMLVLLHDYGKTIPLNLSFLMHDVTEIDNACLGMLLSKHLQERVGVLVC